jgi:hypothetical protein
VSASQNGSHGWYNPDEEGQDGKQHEERSSQDEQGV